VSILEGVLPNNLILETQKHLDLRSKLISEGVDILFTVFQKVGQQRPFPRTIMTKELSRQKRVVNKEQIMYWFERSKYEDCRINAYPTFLSKAEEYDYGNGINLNFFTPNILFIDLDKQNFGSRQELDTWLKRILNHIKNVLYDIKPLVLWSGNGYHMIVPVSAPEALEQYEDFQLYTNQPSNEFLQFAKDSLSLGKADSKNNPSFKSCLLRVPYTFNSKCIYEHTDPEVKIVHSFSNTQTLPNIGNLLIEFQTFLVDRNLKLHLTHNHKNKDKDKYHNNLGHINGSSRGNNTIPYIEKLLGIALADNRKFATSLILAPYFVNVLHLSLEDSFNRIRQWVNECAKVKKLEPSVEYFHSLIEYSIERARNTGFRPLKLKETLRYKNKQLFEILA
jgi:hypothetical protein